MAYLIINRTVAERAIYSVPAEDVARLLDADDGDVAEYVIENALEPDSCEVQSEAIDYVEAGYDEDESAP